MYLRSGRTLALLVILSLTIAGLTFSVALSAPKTYDNAAYGFYVDYPRSLDIREYGVDIAAIGVVQGDAIDSVAEMRVITIDESSGIPYIDTLVRELSNLCAADGPTASIRCTGASSIEPFTTDSGLTGLQIQLQALLSSPPQSETQETFEKGPYFIVPISETRVARTVLVIHAPLNESASESNAEAIESIARSYHTRFSR